MDHLYLDVRNTMDPRRLLSSRTYNLCQTTYVRNCSMISTHVPSIQFGQKEFYNEFLASCIALCFHASFSNDMDMPDPNWDSVTSSEDENGDENENGSGNGDDNDSNTLVR